MTHAIYDLETLKNLFIAVFEDYKNDEKQHFIIHDLQNDFQKFKIFIKSAVKHKFKFIGFNNLAFDGQVLQYIVENMDKWDNFNGCKIANLIYLQAQHTINKSNNGEHAQYPEWKLSIPQIDLFKMNHWDNKNKMCSLKWCQFSMDWHNVQEMPIHHNIIINTMEEIEIVLNYCYNDVSSTKNIYNLCKSQLQLRQTISKKYNLNCLSYSNTKIGSELLLQLYCNKTGKNPDEVKKLRTFRNSISFKDVIFQYIEFQSNDFNNFLEKLKTITVTDLKGSFDYTLNYKGFNLIYGTGGIHQCAPSKVYRADSEFCIIDADVALKVVQLKLHKLTGTS